MQYAPKIPRIISLVVLTAAVISLTGCASNLTPYELSKRQAQSQSFAGKASLYDLKLRH